MGTPWYDEAIKKLHHYQEYISSTFFIHFSICPNIEKLTFEMSFVFFLFTLDVKTSMWIEDSGISDFLNFA